MRLSMPFGRACSRLFAILALGALAACGARPQILSLNYQVIQMADTAAADALVRQLERGDTRLEDQMRSPCNFTASFAVVPPPAVDALSPQGPLYERIEIRVPTPVNLTTTNPPACPSIAELGILIGRGEIPLRLGVDLSRGQGRMAFGTGEAFPSQEMFTARLSAFRPGFSAYRAAGDVSWVARPVSGSNRLLLVRGTFDLRQP